MQAEKAWKFNLEHSKDKFLLPENLTQNVIKYCSYQADEEIILTE